MVTGRLEQREYTTREGDKRTAIDVIADELGPSLRWATAQVERTPRKDGAAKKTGGSTSPAGDSSPFEGEEPF